MKNVLVIGGGTGSFTILQGLKKYHINLSAIVTMADDGGSTGTLRSEYGLLPIGDIRNCLVALSEDTKIMVELFNHRFDKSLKNHSFGNLFLAALKDITGNYENAIKEASKILNVRGEVFPVTLDNIRLHAELEDGTIIKGETNIDIPKHSGEIPIKKVFLHPEAHAYYKAIEAINNADVIVLGPGDLFTSIIPNILVKGIKDAINESNAKKIYVCNLMTKHGETNDFAVEDFYNVLISYLGPCIDYVVYNRSDFPAELLETYAQQKQYPVYFSSKDIIAGKPRFIEKDLVNPTNMVRHDPQKLAKAIIDLC